MYRPPRRQSCFVNIRVTKPQLPLPSSRFAPKNNNNNNNNEIRQFNKNNNNFSSMKLFDRFRKIVMRFMFSSSTKNIKNRGQKHGVDHHQRPDDPPKTSCNGSYHYSPNSHHYTEAIADCIEFFNRSSQDGGSYNDYYGRKSDALV
ncbi:hypothetical protein MKW94_019653 [Papaver nudicaule]|uniref:Uncharacterized protein n=1 Tax=Papaver nudicaule TaxID=74823 RepID=A0AA41VGD1_PAPNU|nr:hypothetical protein [Papaver nudicaule]